MRTRANPGADQLLTETLKLYAAEGHTLSNRAVGWRGRLDELLFLFGIFGELQRIRVALEKLTGKGAVRNSAQIPRGRNRRCGT